MFFRSEGSLGAKKAIVKKTHVLLSFFDDFEGPRDEHLIIFSPGGDLFDVRKSTRTFH